jgi:Ribbon-helix-helix protein, copG family
VKNEKALAEELEKTRDDPGEWSEVPVDIQVRPNRTQVVSFRLPVEELEMLTSAASLAGESVSEFIREAIESRTRQRFSPSVYGVSFGGKIGVTVYGGEWTAFSWADNENIEFEADSVGVSNQKVS